MNRIILLVLVLFSTPAYADHNCLDGYASVRIDRAVVYGRARFECRREMRPLAIPPRTLPPARRTYKDDYAEMQQRVGLWDSMNARMDAADAGAYAAQSEADAQKARAEAAEAEVKKQRARAAAVEKRLKQESEARKRSDELLKRTAKRIRELKEKEGEK